MTDDLASAVRAAGWPAARDDLARLVAMRSVANAEGRAARGVRTGCRRGGRRPVQRRGCRRRTRDRDRRRQPRRGRPLPRAGRRTDGAPLLPLRRAARRRRRRLDLVAVGAHRARRAAGTAEVPPTARATWSCCSPPCGPCRGRGRWASGWSARGRRRCPPAVWRRSCASEPDLFAADVMLVADAGNVELGTPTVTSSLRGTGSVLVTVRDPGRAGALGHVRRRRARRAGRPRVDARDAA